MKMGIIKKIAAAILLLSIAVFFIYYYFVRFTYEELQEVNQYLVGIVSHHHNNGYVDAPFIANVSAQYVDIRRNRVVIELFEYSEEWISLFRETVYDSRMLYFMPSIGLPQILPAPELEPPSRIPELRPPD